MPSSLYQQIIKDNPRIQMEMDAPEKKILSCGKHGEYEGWIIAFGKTDVPAICPECLKDEAREDQREIYQREALNKSKSIFNCSCIPKRFQDRGLRNYEPVCDQAAKIKEILTQYVKNLEKVMHNGTSFLFTGSPGTGKTHLGCAVAMNVISLGRTATYISAADCVAKVKVAWLRNAEDSEDCMIEKFSKFDLLILDEITRLESFSEKEKSILFRVLNRRYENCLPTFGITKYSRKVLEKIMGEEFVSRIESGGGGTLSFNWDNYRMRNSINVR